MCDLLFRSRFRAPLALTVAATVTLLSSAPRQAHAYCNAPEFSTSNDLSLECLVGQRASGQSPAPTLREQSTYRSLLSELSTVMAVPILHPADTVGFTGFHFSFDITTTSINRDAEYWSFSSGSNVGTHAGPGVRDVSGSVLPVIAVMLRKGMWLPIPPISAELGVGASNLLYSGIYGLDGYLKLALQEGYHRTWIPSVAVRGAVSRIAGASQVDLTVLNIDGLVSKAFGVGGTVTAQPYLGGGGQFSIVRSEVINTAPTQDLYRGPAPPAPPLTAAERTTELAAQVTFPTQDNIARWRLFAGLELDYAIVALNLSFAYFGAGQDHGYNLDNLPSPANAQNQAPGQSPACRVGPAGAVCPKDIAAAQYQIGIGLGVRF